MTRFAPLWLQAGTYPASLDRRLFSALFPNGGVSGCAVTPGTGMAVTVAPGSVAVPAANATGSVLCVSDANETVTLDPADSNPRVDLVVCQVASDDIGAGTGDTFTFVKVKGTPAASNPPVPATPQGALALARVSVAAGSATIAPTAIVDVRTQTLAVPGSPHPGDVLACVRVTNANYYTSSQSYVPINAGTAVLPITVPLSGRVLVSISGLFNNGAAGVMGSVAWSAGTTANTGWVNAGVQRTGNVDGNRHRNLESVAGPHAGLPVGQPVTLCPQWAVYNVSGTLTLGQANSDVILKAIAL